MKNNEGKLKLKINKWEKLSKIYEEAFINDYKLGYVSSSETTDVYKSAFEIVNVYDGVIKKIKMILLMNCIKDLQSALSI